MTTSRWFLVAACVVLLGVVMPVAAEVAPKAEDLVGTWELVGAKDIKTGAPPAFYGVAGGGTQWMQFTRSHWMILHQAAGRKGFTAEEFNKLSPDAQVKANYALIWNDKNQRLFQARGGTYTLQGDMLHQTNTIIVSANIGNGADLKITRLDKTTLVVQAAALELTYRRLD